MGCQTRNSKAPYLIPIQGQRFRVTGNKKVIFYYFLNVTLLLIGQDQNQLMQKLMLP